MKKIGGALIVTLSLATAVSAFEWNDLLGGETSAGGSERPWQESGGPASDDEIRAVGVDLDVAEMMRNRTGGPPRLLRAAGADTPLGLVWSIDAPSAVPLVRSLREELGRKGLVVFVATRRFGTGPDEIGIVKVEGAGALIAKLGTPGPEAGVTAAALVEKLQAWTVFAAWDLIGAGRDWIDIEFRTPPTDVDRLLDEAASLAPSAIGASGAQRERTRDELAKTRRLSLWWDAR